MGLKKGMTNNPKGRPAGAKNKASGKLREDIALFLETKFEQVKADYRRLPPRERLKVYTELLPYAVPKLQSTDISIDFESLSEEQLDLLMSKWVESTNK